MKKYLILLFGLLAFQLHAKNPPLGISGATNVCANQTVTYSSLTKCIGTATYFWNVPSGGYIVGSSNSRNVNVRWTGTGTRTLTVTTGCYPDDLLPIDGDPIIGGGTSFYTLDVNVQMAPPAPSMQDAMSCTEGELMRLQVMNPNSSYNYRWYTSNTATNPIATTDLQGHYHEVTTNSVFYVATHNGVCESNRVQVRAQSSFSPQSPDVNGLTFSCAEQPVILGVTPYLIPIDEDPVIGGNPIYPQPDSYVWEKLIAGLWVEVGNNIKYIADPEIADYRVKAIAGGCESGYVYHSITEIKETPVLDIAPINSHGDKIFDESQPSVKVVTAIADDGNGKNYYFGRFANPSNSSAIPRYLNNGQTITLQAYKNGCWSEPKTYTAVGQQAEEMNWTLSRSFDENGNVVSTSKTYFDEAGKALQSQTKVFLDDRAEVFASQPVYDSLNRPVVSTLSAPVNQDQFAYKPNFITTGGEIPTDETFTNAIDDTERGTLGWYYSHNNDLEPLQAVTDYPFSRTEFLDDGTGAVRRSVSAGDNFAITNDPTSGQYAFGHSFALLQDMDEYLQIKYDHVFPNATNTITTLAFKGGKSVSRNTDGRESIGFTDLNGHGIASALLGPTFIDKTVTVNAPLSFPVFWSNFDYTANADQTEIRLKIGGTECVQVFRKFAGQDWEQVYLGSPYHTDFYREGATNVAVRLETDPTEMQIQVRVFEGFTLQYQIGEAWHDPTLSEVNGGMSVLDFHIPEKANSATTPFTIHTEDGAQLPVTIIKLDDLVEKEKAVFSPDLVSDRTINFGKGFYRLKVGASLELNKQMAVLEDYSQVASASYSYQLGNLAYHFYDEVGNIRASISPNGVAQLRSGVAYADIDKTTYKYTTDGRVLEMNEIDAGKTEYVYREDGAIRFSRSAKQEANGKFSYTTYDNDGRPIESGEYTVRNIKDTQEPRFAGNTFVKNPGDAFSYVVDPEILESNGIENTDMRGVYLTGGLLMMNTSDLTRTFYDEPDPNFSLRTQNFLWGNVAYTQFVNNGEDNDIISQTWYSYDDLGRVEWVAQQLEGLSGIKLVEYTYDYFGKVTEVIYQAGTSEAFHHKYSYDASQRLQNVETSQDGQTWAQQAKYIYYLHGPLKRVEMGDELQGMDYAYTLHGWLKSVNNLYANDDMGGDGLTNTFAADVFSMQLDYFEGDYVSAKADNPIATITGKGNKPKSISGNIAGMAWRTQKPGTEAMTAEKDMFVFDYDERYQILNAKYGKVVNLRGAPNAFVADANDAFGLQMGVNRRGLQTYDRNGNIQGLVRKNEFGAVRDEFDYKYTGNTNRLEEVGIVGLANQDPYAQYEYNEIGELVRENNSRTGKDLTIKYDAYGKVSEVKDNNVLLAQYTYNERGQRVRKKVFSPTGEAKTTFYVRDAGGNVLSIYEADESESLPMTQKELPIYGMSRLGQLQLNTENNEFEAIYEAKDHLGNVRATFREGRNYVNNYFTDIDNGTLLNGEPVQGDQPSFDVDPSYLDMTKAHSESLSALLSDGESIEMWLPVQNGDDLFAEVYFNSDELPENGGLPGGRVGGSVNPALTTGSLMSIGSMPNLGGEGKTGAPSVNINALAVAGLLIKNKTSEPLGANGTDLNYYKSWIRMELYQSKDDTDPISSKSAQIILRDTERNIWKSASLDWTGLDMPDDWCEGFVKVYIENQGSERIWFDDISVEHTHNPGKIEVVSYKDYYPFGAEMRGSCIDNQGRYGYQGDYAEQDKETGWNAFELRMYDPLIGRSTSVDPYRQYHSPYMWVGNNPINMVDPDGGNGYQVLLMGNKQAAMDIGIMMDPVIIEGSYSLAERTNDGFWDMMRSGDNWWDQNGEGIAKGINDLNPLVSATHLVHNELYGTNAYGEKMTGGDQVFAVSDLIPQVKGLKLGVKQLSIIAVWTSKYYKVHRRTMDALEHVWRRHGFGSTYQNVSRFSSSFRTPSQLKGFITTALNSSDNIIHRFPDGSFDVIHDAGKVVGVNQAGNSTTKMMIHLDADNAVKSAYPY